MTQINRQVLYIIYSIIIYIGISKLLHLLGICGIFYILSMVGFIILLYKSSDVRRVFNKGFSKFEILIYRLLNLFKKR